MNRKNYRLIGVINLDIIKQFYELIKQFGDIFDILETTSVLTLHKVVPALYLIKENLLKFENNPLAYINDFLPIITGLLDTKYYESLTHVHWAATILDSCFKSLPFISSSMKEGIIDDTKTTLESIFNKTLPPSDVDDSMLLKKSSIRPVDPLYIFRKEESLSLDSF